MQSGVKKPICDWCSALTIHWNRCIYGQIDICFKSLCIVTFLFCVDIPHDSFVNDKGKVQTHTFTDFPPTAESDEEDVYDKTQVQGKSLYSCLPEQSQKLFSFYVQHLSEK